MTDMYVNILAHRGLWYDSAEKNRLIACERAFSLGYGIEVDIRDNAGGLIVAHDAQDTHAYPFSDLCKILQRFPECCAAINIKSCGLQKRLKDMLAQYNVKNYFTFDMTIPDLLANVKFGIISFTRHSEYEQKPALYLQADGVWIDMFVDNWLTGEIISEHLNNGKNIAIVSPELHKRPHELWWQKLKNVLQIINKQPMPKLYLCTDYPQQAHRYFNA